MIVRDKVERALAKPLPGSAYDVGPDVFMPWEDVIEGIFGSYASESDEVMIAALEAVRDKQTFEFIDQRGFLGEFVLYVLAGHGLTEYGTSPRGGWPAPEIEGMWQQLIDKWRDYARVVWKTLP